MMGRVARQSGIGCMKVARLLQSYLDGETDPDTAGRVAAHLGLCRRCGMKAATYRAIKASLARNGRWDDLTRRRVEEFTHRIRQQLPSSDSDT